MFGVLPPGNRILWRFSLAIFKMHRTNSHLVVQRRKGGFGFTRAAAIPSQVGG
jgi:hypothetical protein